MKMASTLTPSSPRRVLARAAAWIAPLALAVFVAAPVGFVLGGFWSGGGISQAHIWTTNGLDYLVGTLLLCLLVGAGAAVIGAGAALLVSFSEFPGRRILSAALALPFAVPAYIGAYAYADLLGPFGAWSRVFGGAPPDIRTLAGAAFILTLSVYPYVYLAMRASFAGRSGALLEAARMLGAGPSRAALMILLPAGRAAFAGGLALALMETAADFGVADYFGVPTLSVGIFRTWYGLGDLAAASQLAGGLFLIALILTILESTARRGLGADSARGQRDRARIRLSPTAALAALVFCAIPVLLGFAAPVALLAAKLAVPEGAGALHGLGDAVRNTTLVAVSGAIAAVLLATLLVYAARRSKTLAQQAALRAATMGYALPGAVIAIGVLGFASALGSAGITLSGFALLLYAYVARFLTAGYNSVAGGIAQIHPFADDAARMLGAGPGRILMRIHWPIARNAFAAGAFVVLIDIAKELPATLLLRPFNFETLATRIYRLASDERLADASPAALILVAVSLAPVLWLEALGRNRGAASD